MSMDDETPSSVLGGQVADIIEPRKSSYQPAEAVELLKFCWWEEKCWNDIADKPRGTVQSHPYIVKQFA
jgi:hypothetical protein